MHLNLEDTDGSALAEFYAERVRGGAGLIVTGGVAVNRVGAGGPTYPIITEAKHAGRWGRVVERVHEEGGRIALQLFHAGRYALESSFGVQPVAPSAIYSRFSRCEPHALTAEEIQATLDDFASGAHVAAELGFDALEIMASEGYLLNQFVSPVTNQRDDEWGGDAQRRRAFPLAVLRAVKQAAGSLPVLIRISGDDLIPGSSTPEEVDALALAATTEGADAVDVGIGWHESRVPTVQSLVPHGVWVETAARIARHLRDARSDVPVIASNRINSVADAERILAEGRVDMVSMARPFLADPRILQTSFAGFPHLVNTCIGCNEACIDRSLGSDPVSCLVNPRTGRELHFPASPPVTETVTPPRTHAVRVLVVGGGPAGMEAARALAVRGIAVTLRESGPRLGGQFLFAGAVPGKRDFLETVRYFENELERLGVTVECNTPVTTREDASGFDHIVVATGVRPRHVDLTHHESTETQQSGGVPTVIDYRDAFRDLTRVGPRVAIVGGGGIAVDLSHLLTEGGEMDAAQSREQFLIDHGVLAGSHSRSARTVTLMRRSGAIGAGMGITTRWAVVQTIRSLGVETLTGVSYRGLTNGGLLIEHEGTDRVIPADTVIIAAGSEPERMYADTLKSANVPHTLIGGARESGSNAVRAFEDGLRVAAEINVMKTSHQTVGRRGRE